jgi:hypothetical protein
VDFTLNEDQQRKQHKFKLASISFDSHPFERSLVQCEEKEQILAGTPPQESNTTPQDLHSSQSAEATEGTITLDTCIRAALDVWEEQVSQSEQVTTPSRGDSICILQQGKITSQDNSTR